MPYKSLELKTVKMIGNKKVERKFHEKIMGSLFEFSLIFHRPFTSGVNYVII